MIADERKNLNINTQIDPNFCLAANVKLFRYMVIALLGLFFLCLCNRESPAAEAAEPYRLCPLKVGQYVEYQIIGIFGKNEGDRYRIEVISKDKINKQDYFWVQFEIFSRTKKEISFKALVSPIDQLQFSKNPAVVISEGIVFLLKNAKRIFLSIGDSGSYHEISPKIFTDKVDILKDSFYSETPYEKNMVDYSKMAIHDKNEFISVPAGNFECYHFEVKTHEWEDYADEGLDLWRSDKVPFLGIVKFEFSKTNYQKKWNYQYSQLFDTNNWWKKLYTYFFIRCVQHNRSDTFVMNLMSYDAGNY